MVYQGVKRVKLANGATKTILESDLKAAGITRGDYQSLRKQDAIPKTLENKILDAAGKRTELSFKGATDEAKNNIVPKQQNSSGRFKPTAQQLEKIKTERAKKGNVRFTDTEKLVMQKEFESQSAKVIRSQQKEYDAAMKSYKKKKASFDKKTKEWEKDQRQRSKQHNEKREAARKTPGFERLALIDRSVIKPAVALTDKKDDPELFKLRKDGYITPKISPFKDAYGKPMAKYVLTDKGKNLIARERPYMRPANPNKPPTMPDKPSLTSSDKFTVTHPTFGTKFTVNQAGLDIILGTAMGKIQTKRKVSSNNRRSRKTADVKGLNKIKDKYLGKRGESNLYKTSGMETFGGGLEQMTLF